MLFKIIKNVIFLKWFFLIDKFWIQKHNETKQNKNISAIFLMMQSHV